MIESLRRRFILFSVLVISGIVIIVALVIFFQPGHPEQPVEHYAASLLLLIGLVFAGSYFLSKLAVKPIQKAWQKQLDFTADASHELRTPLAVIRTNLELVMDSPEETVGSQMKWLKNIEAENHRMTRLLEDLLTLSRADTGRQSLEKETFLLNEVISEALAPFWPAAEAKGIRLAIKADEETAFHGDRKRMTQLAVILLDNALHYTERGEVTVSLGGNEKEVTLTVADTGRGIEAEHLGNIFGRFYRVTNTRGMHPEGSGLGLSIAKWIAAEHGGTIRVNSTPGSGSVFAVRLPDRANRL